VPSSRFELICEVEPATRPDLASVRQQVGVMTPVASAFLIPDNHLGRATVSSIAVAHEVAAMGSEAIACVNSRDRNRLGFRRDLLTAGAYGVERFLCVYGDDPESGGRAHDLNVRTMLDEVRTFGSAEAFAGRPPFRLGVTSRLSPLPGWKREADFVLVQATFDLQSLLRWRDTLAFGGPVYAGVLVVASAAMAKTLQTATRQISVPAALIDNLDADRDAGVDAACTLLEEIRDSGAFDGVHLIPVGRFRQVAARLEALGLRQPNRAPTQP
jgi:methylenetetrahydrofolate reductase (NADPH)